MHDLPTMLPLREASTQTGISYDELRRLCLEGRVANLRVGSRRGKILINFNCLLDFLNKEGLGDDN